MKYTLALALALAAVFALYYTAVWLIGRLLYGKPVPKWRDSCARHRVPEPPRYPWSQPPRVDPFPDVPPPARLEVPPMPDTPPAVPADATQPIPQQWSAA